MCLSALFRRPDVPKLAPLPRTPTIDDDAVRARASREAARLASQGGTASTVKTDLSPTSLVGQKRVLLGV